MIEMEVMGHVPTEGAVEAAFAYAKQLGGRPSQARSAVEQGLRIARARDPKLLVWLERAAEVLERQHENQRGQTRRSTSDFTQKFEPQVVQMWREAYRTADQGSPAAPFGYIYAAAGTFAGLIPRC